MISVVNKQLLTTLCFYLARDSSSIVLHGGGHSCVVNHLRFSLLILPLTERREDNPCLPSTVKGYHSLKFTIDIIYMAPN